MAVRRTFLLQATSMGALLALSCGVEAQAPMVDEKSATAQSLGYVADTARANQTKYPAHAATQACANCQLYQGKAGDAAGPCPLYAGQAVSAKGWCSAYTKKAG